ncbi:MAG: DUF3810 domain-containing protein [Clostridia bacterium]|nr:DUF3810 domain-containing protein [Clostridia bacterium]
MKKFILPIFAVLLYLTTWLLKHFPNQVNTFYSEDFNAPFVKLLSKLTGIFPGSLAEWIILIHLFLLPILLVTFIISIKSGFYKVIFRYLLQYLSLIYILFMFFWGFNYYRSSIGALQNLDETTYSLEKLEALTLYLIDEANTLRSQLKEDENGIFMIPEGKTWILENAHVAYDFLQEDYPIFEGTYGQVKPILFSKVMLYTGITGFYFPFTGEANVNVKTMDLMFPATVLHEMAHQRGFGPEDEANYIAFLASRYHPDMNFRYSGTILALIHSQNALYKINSQMVRENQELYSEGLSRDLKAHREFWQQYDGIIEKTSSKINDTYLKTNHVYDGLQSYGNMVDWVLSYYEQLK